VTYRHEELLTLSDAHELNFVVFDLLRAKFDDENHFHARANFTVLQLLQTNGRPRPYYLEERRLRWHYSYSPRNAVVVAKKECLLVHPKRLVLRELEHVWIRLKDGPVQLH
jgi:hypothetical protein